MVKSSYHYTVEVFRTDGSRVGEAAVDADWETADQWARFVALRRGQLSNGDASGSTSIEPVWHPTIGAPYISGFRVCIADREGAPDPIELTTAYFQGLAQAATARFVEGGSLEAGERIVYLTTAFRSRAEPLTDTAAAFDVEEVGVPLPLPDASLADSSCDAVLVGDGNTEDVPVFIPQTVLDEAAALALQVEATETGGILIGHVHRDPKVRDLFVRVTAQIPARHTAASATKLTFTAETWTDVRAALALRHRGEIMLGWWHSHPARHWCRNCPVERQDVCALARNFFSDDDRALHRAVFAQGYGIALVVNDGVRDQTFSLFGWRHGLVASRAFGVLGASRPAAAFEPRSRSLEGEPCSRHERASSISASSSTS